MSKAENHKVEKLTLNGIDLRSVSYKIGEKYFCHIENVDPGATIARAEGVSAEEAKKAAMEKVSGRL